MKTVRIRTNVRPSSGNSVRVSTTVSNGSRSTTRTKTIHLRRR